MSASDAGDSSVNIVHGTHSQLVVFLFLNMWPSHLGIPILLAIIFFSKNVQRHPTFLNLCLAFMIVGFSSSLLVYTGKTEGPEPSKMLCLLQASLLYGYPALSSLSAFALVFQMFVVIRNAFYGYNEKQSVILQWAILIMPYFVWLISILATAAVGAANPQNISRNRRFFYCSVESSPLTNTITIVAAFILFVTFVLEVWTVYFFYQRWWCAVNHNKDCTVFKDINLVVRILAFAIFLIIAMSLSLLSIRSPESPVPDLVIATAPTVVILIFGTQTDILRAVCFWKRDTPPITSKAEMQTIYVDLTNVPPLECGHKPRWKPQILLPRETPVKF